MDNFVMGSIVPNIPPCRNIVIRLKCHQNFPRSPCRVMA